MLKMQAESCGFPLLIRLAGRRSNSPLFGQWERGYGVSDEKDGVVEAQPAEDGVCLTKTQRELLRFIAGETAVGGGVSCTKRELANRFGRNVKTIDRCLADLRRRGLVEAEMAFDERGAQVASRYRAVLQRGA